MDLTHDGIPDIISGSYPGEIFLFAGQKDGSYLKGVKLQGKDGNDLKVDRASAVCVNDWDRDGDLDLLVGNIKGEVWFIANEAEQDRAAPSFGEPKKLGVGAKSIEAPGRNAGPHVADWDGDGVDDLVLGCGDGSVRVYRNTTAGGMPVLAAPVEIVPKCASYARARSSKAPQPQGPQRGYRAKVWVTDWNGDGRSDLLVGDCVSMTEPAPKLTNEQTVERDRLVKAQQEIRKNYQKVSARIQEKLEQECGHTLRNAPPEKRAEVMKVWRRLLTEDEGYQAYLKGNREIYQKLRPLQPKRSTHGHVWVYLRKGPRQL